MTKHQKPTIRFSGFTDDWEQRKLGELVNIKSGWSPSNFIETNKNDNLFIKVDDLNYSTREQIDSRMKVEEHRIYQKMHKGSTIFPKRGAAILTNKVRVLKFDSYMDTNMMALEPKSLNANFLFTFISKTGLYKIADTSTIPQINNKHIEPYSVFLPEMKEQIKIGSFFQQLDETITLQERELGLLKEQKKGFLQKMFPKQNEKVPELRFKDFTDDWEQRKLNGLVKFSKGKGYTKGDLLEEGDPIILYGRLYTNYQTRIIDVDTYVDSQENSILSEGGEVIVPSSGETSEDIARGSVVINNGIILGGDLNIIKPSEKIEPSFLALTISNGESQKELMKKAQGNSVVHLYNSDLKEVKIFYPNFEEQTRIGNFFNQLDETITLQEQQLKKMKEMKKGFLQKMFV